jgi:acetamidase/formamidase
LLGFGRRAKRAADEGATAAKHFENRAARRRKLDKYKYEARAAPVCGVAARAQPMIGLCGATGEAYDELPEMSKPA